MTIEQLIENQVAIVGKIQEAILSEDVKFTQPDVILSLATNIDSLDTLLETYNDFYLEDKDTDED